jgi:hypothetical protein
MNELLQDALNLDKNKSTGTDYIGPKILKVSAPFAVYSLLKFVESTYFHFSDFQYKK